MYLWCNITPIMTMGEFTIAVPGATNSVSSSTTSVSNISSSTNTDTTSSSSSTSSIKEASSTLLYTTGNVDKDEQESFAKLLATKLKKIIYLSYNIQDNIPIDSRILLQRVILSQIMTL